MELGVINWFKKKRMEVIPGKIDEGRADLINEIVRIGNNTRDTISFYHDVFKLFKESEILLNVSSDTTLPVCSLFHHLQNTSALSVCFSRAKGYSDDEVVLLGIAGLLHDIGKLHPNHYKDHQNRSSDFVEDVLKRITANPTLRSKLSELPRLVGAHHSRTASKKDEKLLSKADSVASAMDRRYEIQHKVLNDFENTGVLQLELTCLDSVFDHTIHLNNIEFEVEGDEKVTMRNGDRVVRIMKYRGNKADLEDRRAFNWKRIQLFRDEAVLGSGPRLYLGEKSNNDELVLIGLDIPGIQRYIGESKKLAVFAGGSHLIEEAEREACDVIAEMLSPANVIMNGGGKLIAIAPKDTDLLRRIKTEMIRRVGKRLYGENYDSLFTKRPVAAGVKISVDDLIHKFGKLVTNLSESLARERNTPRKLPAEDSPLSTQLCDSCSIRKRVRKTLCEACYQKKMAHRDQTGRKGIVDGIVRPSEVPWKLEHLGRNIAVLIFDGNEMGKIYRSTPTPAEYAFKSTVFDRMLRESIKEAIGDVIDELGNIAFTRTNEGVFASVLDIYIGGDDVMIACGAPLALRLAQRMVSRVANNFYAETAGKRTVTISGGVVLGRYNFPIHYMIDCGQELESISKSAYRSLKGEKPQGSLSLSSVSDAAPTSDRWAFIVDSDGKTRFVACNDEGEWETGGWELGIIESLAGLDEDEGIIGRSLVNLITSSSLDETERFDLVKYLYSSIGRKEVIPRGPKGMEVVHMVSDVLRDVARLKAVKQIVPLISKMEVGT